MRVWSGEVTGKERGYTKAQAAGMGGVGLQDSGTGLPYPSRVSGGSVFPLLTTLLKRVLMSPGAKQFTLMFFEASSAAKFLVRPSKAVLLTL